MLGIMKGQRLSVGGRVFVPTGRPKVIGRANVFGSKQTRGLARVVTYGVARTITIFVGQNKGVQPKNTTGRCARKPGTFSVGAVDRAFLEARAQEIGAKFVGARRVVGRGWYEGADEASVAYEVAFIPSPAEKTYRQFKANMDRLAEQLAPEFCQDSVLIIRDDGKRRTVAGAEWTPKGGR